MPTLTVCTTVLLILLTGSCIKWDTTTDHVAMVRYVIDEVGLSMT